jgi:CRP-like cAMP-binding protein
MVHPSEQRPAGALLLKRLRSHVEIGEDDAVAVLDLPYTIRTLEPSTYLLREGEPPQSCPVLIDGFVFRQKVTRDGERAIVALHIPGDPLDFQSLFLAVADHNLQVMTRATVALIARSALEEAMRTRPAIANAVMVSATVDASIGREWLLNIGRRSARERLAHLLCEFACRMEAHGLAASGDCALPMTQEQLGDALGLTSVHVNRTLRGLEAEGAIQRDGRRIRFDDWNHIRAIADFSALYLHLNPVVAA